jgi:hypothetical protein
MCYSEEAPRAGTEVLQRPLNSRVTPRGILFRHSDREAPNLAQHSVTTRATYGERPLRGDELPMPPE